MKVQVPLVSVSHVGEFAQMSLQVGLNCAGFADQMTCVSGQAPRWVSRLPALG